MAKKEKYESMRIMSLEGSVLYKNEGFSATKNGKPNPGAFRGVLDESLDTLKLAEVRSARGRDRISLSRWQETFLPRRCKPLL